MCLERSKVEDKMKKLTVRAQGLESETLSMQLLSGCLGDEMKINRDALEDVHISSIKIFANRAAEFEYDVVQLQQ